MNKKLIAVMVVGLAAGGAHFAYVERLEAEVRGGAEREVLVTARDLKKGQAVAKSEVATRRVPSTYVDKRVIGPDDLGDIVGLPIAVTLEAGQMLQWSDFLDRDDGAGVDLASLVGPGERAMTIPVNMSLSMGGNLRPGHRVDILGTFDEGQFPSRGKKSRSLAFGKDQKIAVTLLQNVTVLATGRDTGASDGAEDGGRLFRTVTLSVSLEESELLAFASTQATLSLVLRGEGDLEIVRDVPEKSIEDVWNVEKRNALQSQKKTEHNAIERLRAR